MRKLGQKLVVANQRAGSGAKTVYVDIIARITFIIFIHLGHQVSFFIAGDYVVSLLTPVQAHPLSTAVTFATLIPFL